jgi:hypothetical protein
MGTCSHLCGFVTIDWARHVRGESADRLKLRGVINPAGLRGDLHGVTVGLRLNEVDLPTVALDARGLIYMVDRHAGFDILEYG